MAWFSDAPAQNQYNQSAGTPYVSNYTGAMDMTHASVPGDWPQSLFYTERFTGSSEHNFVFPVDSTTATFRVRIGLSENYAGITGAGQRVFDVLVNGTTIASNVDLYALVGQHKAYVLTANVVPATGQITVSTVSRVQSALINAIEVAKVSGNSAPVFSGGSFAVASGLPSGSTIATLSATDPDIGQTLTWSFTGSGPFALGSSSGVLSTTGTLASSTSYPLTVTVTDNGSPQLATSATVTVSVGAPPPPPPSGGGEPLPTPVDQWPFVPPRVLDEATLNELRRLVDQLSRLSLNAVGDLDAKLDAINDRLTELGG